MARDDKADKQGQSGGSDEESEDSDADSDDNKRKSKKSKDTNLFTKMGVPQQDIEDQIKRDFQTQAEQSDDNIDDFLKIKKNAGGDSDSEEKQM